MGNYLEQLVGVLFIEHLPQQMRSVGHRLPCRAALQLVQPVARACKQSLPMHEKWREKRCAAGSGVTPEMTDSGSPAAAAQWRPKD